MAVEKERIVEEIVKFEERERNPREEIVDVIYFVTIQKRKV